MARDEEKNNEEKINYVIELSEDVEADIIQIYDWYEDKRQGLGSILLQELEQSLFRIQHHPDSYRKRYKNLRLDKMNRFPYLVIFKLEKKTVTILKVVHGKRHPKIWKSLAK